MKNCFLGHPFRVHHATIVAGGAPPAYPAVTERRRLQRLPFDEEETEEQKYTIPLRIKPYVSSVLLSKVPLNEDARTVRPYLSVVNTLCFFCSFVKNNLTLFCTSFILSKLPLNADARAVRPYLSIVNTLCFFYSFV